MHWQQLLDVTKNYGKLVKGQRYDTAYKNAMRSLQRGSPQADMGRNIDVFEDFLREWNSLRGGRPDREKLNTVWMQDVEPYAEALDGEFLEDLDVRKMIEVGVEKLHVRMAIEHMYAALHIVRGIGKTNASKLLHLRLPNLFVMTDANVRDVFRGLWPEGINKRSLFLPYGYAFHFLPLVRADILEAILTLQEEKGLTRREAIEYLQNAHGRKRSLAKLADEYYYTGWSRDLEAAQ